MMEILDARHKRGGHHAPQRHPMQIDYAIMDAIFRGARTKGAIARMAKVNCGNLKAIRLQRLEEQGFVVSVDAGFKREVGHKGGHQWHYALTEKAKLWMIIQRRAEELAPK